MSDLPNPINRYEKYLNAIATGNSDDLPTPITREEVFLDYIAKNGGGGGGGGDVTGVKGNAESTYRRGNVNLTPAHLGLGKVDNTSDLNKPVSTAQQTALDGKVDKVIGKGLSENDYTDADKAIVGGVTSALAGKANSSDLGDKSNLTTNDKSSAVAAINEVNSGLTNIGNATDLGNVQGSGNITLSEAVTNFRFIQILVGYYGSGYPCFGQALLPVSTLYISAEDTPITVAFQDGTGSNSGHANISFLSATSVKVVNTSSTLYTKLVGII